MQNNKTTKVIKLPEYKKQKPTKEVKELNTKRSSSNLIDAEKEKKRKKSTIFDL